jgi:hypothetical protein
MIPALIQLAVTLLVVGVIWWAVTAILGKSGLDVASVT